MVRQFKKIKKSVDLRAITAVFVVMPLVLPYAHAAESAPSAQPVIEAKFASLNHNIVEVAPNQVSLPVVLAAEKPAPAVTVAAAPAPKATATTSAKKWTLKPGVEQWRELVSQYNWPVEQALAIMSCESGGYARAVSSTNDHGLFQIHKGLQLYGEKIYDPAFNVWLAYEGYYKKRGWQPWSCARKLGIR